MQFPKFVKPDLYPKDILDLVSVLETSKNYLWDGDTGHRGNTVEFICHAIDCVFDEDFWGCSLPSNVPIKFIQSNIDGSMHVSKRTFACWRETVYNKVHSDDPEYNQYLIDVQSHRKAWIDYLIQNLKETQNENQ